MEYIFAVSTVFKARGCYWGEAGVLENHGDYVK